MDDIIPIGFSPAASVPKAWASFPALICNKFDSVNSTAAAISWSRDPESEVICPASRPNERQLSGSCLEAGGEAGRRRRNAICAPRSLADGPAPVET